MSAIPIVLDHCPAYLRGADAHESLLSLPTGVGTLLEEVIGALAAVTPHRPLVMPLFAFDEGYERAILAGRPKIGGIVPPHVFRDPLARFDPTDQLLIVSPLLYPADGLDLRALVGDRKRAHDRRMMRHLLAIETSSLGTREFVQSGAEGGVRRIQRYFDPVTWPFTTGVIATLVPVACLLSVTDVPLTSLEELRSVLATRGVPSTDVPLEAHLVNLADEESALALGEWRVLDLAKGSGETTGSDAMPRVTGEHVRVDPTARLLGPVVLAEGAVVEADALVIGPTLVGPGARIGRGAVVAQCLLTARASVPAGAVMRHRVLITSGTATTAGTPRPEPAHRRSTHVARPTREYAAPRWRLHLPYATVKAVAEPIIAVAALLLLLPLLLVVALLVKLTSSGPIFYGDAREGKGGRPFRCWKFRSMLVNADAMQRALATQQQVDGPQFKMTHDPRVTRVGSWLRRLNVDELPQLVNVALGEMSFVGPRPSPFRENQICVPWRDGRLSVRPGITGLWQICRRDRASGDFHQWIYYDLLYVGNVSLMVDLKILAYTVRTLGGRYPVRLEAVLPTPASALPRHLYHPPSTPVEASPRAWHSRERERR